MANESTSLITPEMVTRAALEMITVELDFLKGIPRPFKYQVKPDTRTPWQKRKDRMVSNVRSWRHSLACWITPYGFDD